MKPHMKRGLTKVALALMLAGYCAVPVAMAEDAAWVASGTTAEFEGTIPWLYREGGNATINSEDADHIKVTSDSKGIRPAGSENFLINAFTQGIPSRWVGISAIPKGISMMVPQALMRKRRRPSNGTATVIMRVAVKRS